MAHVLVTGSTGLVGQCLLEELIKRGARVTCIGRSRNGVQFADRLRQLLRGRLFTHLPRAETVVKAIDGDLADLTGLNLVDVPDHVIHVAALTDFRSGPSAAARLDAVNVQGTARLVDAIADLPSPPRSFTLVSSAYSANIRPGHVMPEDGDLDGPFHNPYQRSKLEAEHLVRSHFAESPTHVRIFRPTVVSGRLDRSPRGFVPKYDVYLGWAKFFLAMKNEVGTSTLPVRIAANLALGLNIVPADFVGACIAAAVLSDDPETSIHVCAPEDLPIGPMLTALLRSVEVDGWQFVDHPPVDPSDIERAYYSSVGAAYTSYIAGDAPWIFDATSLERLCRRGDVPRRGVSTPEDFQIMLDFARSSNWGLPS
ncbi:MAG: SDR family oxidoreductase [Myxococcota bacterium]